MDVDTNAYHENPSSTYGFSWYRNVMEGPERGEGFALTPFQNKDKP
jgi:hypothetical protein